jgi:hypothetical protein
LFKFGGNVAVSLAEYNELLQEKRRLKRQLAEMMLTKCLKQAKPVSKRLHEIKRRIQAYKEENNIND